MGCSPRVLVVDDDSAFRECIAGVLEAQGSSVYVACDGADALAKLMGEALPDLVLLDVRMPKMDRYEVLAAMRANSRFALVRVIALTAADFEDAAVPSLAKPFGFEELLHLMASVMAEGAGPEAGSRL
jgi:CheY-like chemotaxis protein